jgi:hypothetical protein
VALAAASRLLGAHAQALAALVPESVLLADARAAGERDPLVLPEAPEALLAALDAALAEVLARTTPVADGALARVGATVRAELAGLLEAVAADDRKRVEQLRPADRARGPCSRTGCADLAGGPAASAVVRVVRTARPVHLLA